MADVQTVEAWLKGFEARELATRKTAYREDLMSGQSYLISGGGSGMGRATAFLIARLGGQVMICGRSEEKLAAVAADIERELGVKIRTRPVNIREPDQVDEVVDAAFFAFGTLDGLINSAGGQFPQHAAEYSRKGWTAVIDTNLNGTWWMMQAAAKRWIEAQTPASITNVIVNYQRGIPQQAHTAAARAAVAHLGKSVAVEWSDLPIRVNHVAPGTIATEGLRNYPPSILSRLGKGNPLRTMGDAWDIAQAIVFLANAETGKFITGEVFHVDGGMQLWGTNWPLGAPERLRDG